MTVLTTSYQVIAESSVAVSLKLQYLMKYSNLGTTSATVHRKIRFIATGSTWFSGTWSYSGTGLTSGSKTTSGQVNLSSGGTYDWYETSGSVTLTASNGQYKWSQSSINASITGDRTFTTGNGSASINGNMVTYTIAYNANSGSGAPSNQTKTHGTTLTLSSTIPTRSNYRFTGWNTVQGGTGTSYQPGGSYTANAAATLYAQWASVVQYAITYNANGGSGGESITQFASGADVWFTNTVPHKTGHRFKEWNTAADGTGTSYAPGAKYTGNADITVYAIYEIIPELYSVWVKVNGQWVH